MSPIQQQVLVAAALFLAFFVTRSVARRRPTLGRLRVPLAAAALFAALEALRVWLPPEWRFEALESLEAPLDFLFSFSLAVAGIRLFEWVVFDLFLQRFRHLQAPDVLKDIVAFAVYVIVFVVIFQKIFHTSLTPLLATSAILTAVIGLAMQDSLGNLFAGISLRMEESLNIGDWVKISGSVGQVLEMRWRALKLLTVDGDIVIFPNGIAAKERIENYSHPAGAHGHRASFGVSYAHPPAMVIAALKDLVSRIPGVLADPRVEAWVADYKDSSILYEIRYWVDDFARHRGIDSETRRLLWYRFQREGIEIPFPIRHVRTHPEPSPAEVAAERVGRGRMRLDSIELFAPLSGEERVELARHCRLLRFAPGEAVVRQGDPGASLYVIDAGRLAVYAGEEAAEATLVGTIGPGDFFGEISLLTGEPRTATVVAVTDVVVYELAADSLGAILAARPSIAEALSRVLAQRKHALEAKSREAPDHSREGLGEETAQSFLQRIRAFFRL